jgi:hypothetical protein
VAAAVAVVDRTIVVAVVVLEDYYTVLQLL